MNRSFDFFVVSKVFDLWRSCKPVEKPYISSVNPARNLHGFILSFVQVIHYEDYVTDLLPVNVASVRLFRFSEEGMATIREGTPSPAVDTSSPGDPFGGVASDSVQAVPLIRYSWLAPFR